MSGSSPAFSSRGARAAAAAALDDETAAGLATWSEVTLPGTEERVGGGRKEEASRASVYAPAQNSATAPAPTPVPVPVPAPAPASASISGRWAHKKDLFAADDDEEEGGEGGLITPLAALLPASASAASPAAAAAAAAAAADDEAKIGSGSAPALALESPPSLTALTTDSRTQAQAQASASLPSSSLAGSSQDALSPGASQRLLEDLLAEDDDIAAAVDALVARGVGNE